MKVILFSLLLLSACNREEKVEAPTPAEAERLNEAEAMLDNLAKDEGPENAAAPSGPNRVEKDGTD